MIGFCSVHPLSELLRELGELHGQPTWYRLGGEVVLWRPQPCRLGGVGGGSWMDPPRVRLTHSAAL